MKTKICTTASHWPLAHNSPSLSCLPHNPLPYLACAALLVQSTPSSSSGPSHQASPPHFFFQPTPPMLFLPLSYIKAIRFARQAHAAWWLGVSAPRPTTVGRVTTACPPVEDTNAAKCSAQQPSSLQSYVTALPTRTRPSACAAHNNKTKLQLGKTPSTGA